MSGGLHFVKKESNGLVARWLPAVCRLCGKPIVKAPFYCAQVAGSRTHCHYYHFRCYPRDSRPIEV